jgi:hypothetical protein
VNKGFLGTVLILFLAVSLCLAEEKQSANRPYESLKTDIPQIKFDQQTINAMQSRTNNSFNKAAQPSGSEEQASASAYGSVTEGLKAPGGILPGVDASNIDPQSMAILQQTLTGVYGKAIQAQTNAGKGGVPGTQPGQDINDIQAMVDNAYNKVSQGTK